MKPFSNIKNQSNFFLFLFLTPSFVTFFCFVIILAVTFPCFLYAHTFLVLADSTRPSSFLFFYAHLSSFGKLYKVSFFYFCSTKPRLEHQHRHRSSSCASFRFFISSYQPFSPSFSFSILLPHLVFSWFQFSQIFFLKFFFEFKKKKNLSFISTFALAYFFLEHFCNFLATLIFLILIFYVFLIAIFFNMLYVLLLQHDLCKMLYLILMQIF